MFFLVVFQRMFQAALEEFGDVVVVNGDVNMSTSFARANQAFVFQPAQLVRDGRFGQADALHQVADVGLAIHQGGENPHTGGVAESFEQAAMPVYEFCRGYSPG